MTKNLQKLLICFFWQIFLCFAVEDLPLGQRILPDGLQQPRQAIKNTLGGFYSKNTTLYFRNSPYRVESEIVVEFGATMNIETGVQMYFNSGVGMKVFGTIRAIGNEFAHIQMLPYQEQLTYDHGFPDFRLIDGPTVRQGRLQVKFRDRWRSVCTQLTNWTSVDTGVTCRSMGYSDGGFWRFYRRNNDTYPLVMPRPGCLPGAKNLWECEGWSEPSKIPLTENLCQGEDDMGLYCWGQPSFIGWAKHWKGLQLYSSPFDYVAADPDSVAVQRESRSRLEFLDILYAGYDGLTKNATAALYIEGVPPFINGLRVANSARDGIYFYEAAGPILIANSTIMRNRGHGIAVDNTLDARFFLNQSIVEHNFGDGIWYRQKHEGMTITQQFLGTEIGTNSKINPSHFNRARRQISYLDKEKPRLDMCGNEHRIPNTLFFPHLIQAHLPNRTAIDPKFPHNNCWMTVSLPPRLPYTYTLQFLSIRNRNPPASRTSLIVCDGNFTFSNICQKEYYRIPIYDRVLPQSVSIKNSEKPLYIALEHYVGTEYTNSPFVAGDIDLMFKIHASVTHKAFYGLNITNSVVRNNTGNGIQAQNIRDRCALSNVTIEGNEGLAGFLVRDGAADIWVNDTSLSHNWGDGMNVSYAGGSINLNTSRLVGNRWRGFAYHYNETIPFLGLRHEILIKGRPANNIYYPQMLIADNLWGGVLIGNICIPFDSSISLRPNILVGYAKFQNNQYHPAIEIFSCQQTNSLIEKIGVTGNKFHYGSGMGFRMEPTVNTELIVNSNEFLNIQNAAILVQNSKHPQLASLPAKVIISQNQIKMNMAQFIVSIGLNEDAPNQKLYFYEQNEIRSNIVRNPFPYLKPRSTPYAVLVVSSSNVIIRNNCFGNPQSDYEIGTELSEHAKRIDARENCWGDLYPANFMRRIFDQFNRYSLARIDIDPFHNVCNERTSTKTYIQQYYRPFRELSTSFELGGSIFENSDLPAGRYTIVEDLHVTPGAKLTLAAGTTFEFLNGVGMLIQGELLRSDIRNPYQPVIFTSKTFQLPKLENIRLVDASNGDEDVLAGRLEVRLSDGQWGTICNRSWTPQLAQLACNQLGLAIDTQHFENWRIFPEPGDLPIRMDNIRCEEREYDLTKCRHDGPLHNVDSSLSCRPTEVVGLRCVQPYWAGVRYSLLANPPTITNQATMYNWIIEKAGLFDFRKLTFSPALQIDWNYHTFNNLTIKDNFYDGLDIIYNDLNKKPSLHNINLLRNRRNGITLRSMGITITNVLIDGNENAGFRYDPKIEAPLQRDIVTWLDRREQPELEANNVYIIPNRTLTKILFTDGQFFSRKFLVTKSTFDCPLIVEFPCDYKLELNALGTQYGLSSKLVIQLVNRANSESDEEIIFSDSHRRWSTRTNPIDFPFVSSDATLHLQYKRTRGTPSIVLLILYLDAQEYVDRFVHVYSSNIKNNQYGISAAHYSNLSFVTNYNGGGDYDVLNRYAEEKLWFQKVNFTGNHEAVVWIHSPQHDIVPGTPIAEINWHIDNCSITNNKGPIVETHRDLYSTANVFHWNFWSNTFANNSHSGISIQLPDTYDLLAKKEHRFLMTENRFLTNKNFAIQISGYYAFANVSSNNFTDNLAPHLMGILELSGMEKFLIMERNRFFNNWGSWMVRVETTSQSLRWGDHLVVGEIQYNYFQFNRYLKSLNDDYVDMWPRSYALGIFGTQKVDVHFNRFRNVLMDFELVAGCKPQIAGIDTMNVTHNWWGVANEAEVSQRIFDLDDWNIFTIGEFSPYYTTEELFINFWWHPKKGQLSYANYSEPSALDLKGRMYHSKTLNLDPERWYAFPNYYRPFRPYRITRDLTIMPGATLTIEKNVEVHVWPNVRILVLGNLIADGNLWQPIRFKPINATEYDESRGRVPTRYRRNSQKSTNGVSNMARTTRFRNRHKRHDSDMRYVNFIWDREKRRAGHDPVFKQFPEIRRHNPYFQRFRVSLDSNGTAKGRQAGFLQLYNATTGEMVPSCDRFFNLRNAQVVCREMGFETQNVYHWLTPRWDYNPKVRILKTYMEPRECRGTELQLDKCQLRLSAQPHLWQCMDNEHFNYVHCGTNISLSNEYIGNWGGITFASPILEYQMDQDSIKDSSMLRHVEIIGGGHTHNDSIQSAALQVIRRSPLLENINITNSSMHGIQVVAPLNNIILSRLNISDNKGQGMSITSINLQTPGPNSVTPRDPFKLPYQLSGILDICATGKSINVESRVLVYYKYDSLAVDCVKVFSSVRNLGFRFLQLNLYGGNAGLGRYDGLGVYAGSSFSPNSLIYRFEANYPPNGIPNALGTKSTVIGLHLRATAADGQYGFLAEVTALPSGPISKSVDEIAIQNSRFINNDRGALEYRNAGELGPNVIIEQSAIENNGYHLFGNLSTSMRAVELNLHNTLSLLFRANSIRHNQGGFMVSAKSSSSMARLNAVVKSCVFNSNSNFTALSFIGNNYQKVTIINNIISLNYALHYDTVLVRGMSANFTRNLISNNVGLHTVDTEGLSRISSDSHSFQHNFFENNLALGHQFQYVELFGYVAPKQQQIKDEDGNLLGWRDPQIIQRYDVENDEFKRRPKRQVLDQSGVSFDWWTHLGTEMSRERSTILVGSAHQKYSFNVFNNPLNPYEITTTHRSEYDTGSVDARENYWGYPGTQSVAAGKIRDASDYSFLIPVNYLPLLESNTSLIEGDCPAGWFQAGKEEFKSCFLFVGASMTYSQAVQTCQEIGAFMPILRNDDVRQREIASRVDSFGQNYVTEVERYYSNGLSYDIPMWISSVFMPSHQCGWMNSRTASIGEENCNNLLPFVCEKGTKSYQEPIMWRKDVILAVILLTILLVLLMFLALCACRKAQNRKENFLKRKEFVRDSLRRSQHQKQQQNNGSGVELAPTTMLKSSAAPPTTFFWPDNMAKPPPPSFSSTSRSSSSLTTTTTTASGFSPSTAGSTTNKRRKAGTSSHNDILRTDKYNSNGGVSKPTKSTAPLQKGVNKFPGVDKASSRSNLVSLNPNPYETTPTNFKNTTIPYRLEDDPSGSFSTSTSYTMGTSSATTNACCNNCASFCGESSIQDSSRTCTTCTSNTSYLSCSTCTSVGEEDLSLNGAGFKADISMDSSAGSSSASETTICAVGQTTKRPLLKQHSLKTNEISSRRDLSELSMHSKDNDTLGSSRSTLVASSRPDLTQRSEINPNCGSDFFRGSGRSILSPSNSNPFLQKIPSGTAPFQQHKQTVSGTTDPAPTSSFFDLQRRHSAFLTNNFQKTESNGSPASPPRFISDSQQSTLRAGSVPFPNFEHSDEEFSIENSLPKKIDRNGLDVTDSSHNSIYMNLPPITSAKSLSSKARPRKPPPTTPHKKFVDISSDGFVTPLETAM